MLRLVTEGIYKKKSVVFNHIFSFPIEKGTKVNFLWDTELKCPTITLESSPYVFRRLNGKWYITAFGQTLPIHFPNGGVPYPFSYYK